MPGYLIFVVLGLGLAFIGFCLAFKQVFVRRLLGRPATLRSAEEDEDPLAYALRIAGVMIMAFGVVIGGMVITAHFAL